VSKSVWSKTAPTTDDSLWCWVRYTGKHGPLTCPARLQVFSSGEAILHTARNDSFIRRSVSDKWLYHHEEDETLRFGPVIEEPS
jgi:hypothetical protein